MRTTLATVLGALLACAACGGQIAPLDEAADASPTNVAPEDASLGRDAVVPVDAGAHVDACDPPAPPPPALEAGAVVCTSWLGRTCVGPGPCICDDTCNHCSCTAGGAWSTTELACTAGGTRERCLGPTTSSCHAAKHRVNCASGTEYFCDPWVAKSCGSGVCPSLACTLHHRDVEGGSVWCCP